MTAPTKRPPNRRAGLPLQHQIYQDLRDAIVAGRLRPGERLLSARDLAASLGVARGTVDAALGRLTGEGYVETRGTAGSFISPHVAAMAPSPAPRAGRAEAVPDPPSRIGAFQPGLPALDAFPRTLWSRLTARAARQLAPAALAYPDPAGLPPLRAAIAAYLALARGIACDAAQVFVTAGYQGALALIARARLRPGVAVWVEDPGYLRARQGLAAAGAVLVPVPVDAEGLDVAAGRARAPHAGFALVTPTHQSPLGMALSLRRRLALLAWAEAAGAWIIEDDYDSEFRYTGPPLPALKSLDRAGRVLYAGSFSKTLSPALRLGYLVVPEAEVAAFAAGSLHQGCPPLEQAIVAAFITEGHFARHLRRMRLLYAVRRAALTASLGEAFGDAARIDRQAGGMHLLLRLPGRDDTELAGLAAASGLAPQPLSALAIEAGGEGGLILGFATVAAEDVKLVARRLAAALGAGRG